MKYEETFIRIARDTIIKEAGKFESTSYWVRKLINVRLTDLQLVTNSLRRWIPNCKLCMQNALDSNFFKSTCQRHMKILSCRPKLKSNFKKLSFQNNRQLRSEKVLRLTYRKQIRKSQLFKLQQRHRLQNWGVREKLMFWTRLLELRMMHIPRSQRTLDLLANNSRNTFTIQIWEKRLTQPLWWVLRTPS